MRDDAGTPGGTAAGPPTTDDEAAESAAAAARRAEERVVLGAGLAAAETEAGGPWVEGPETADAREEGGAGSW